MGRGRKGKGRMEASRSRSAGREASSGEEDLLTLCVDTGAEEAVRIWCGSKGAEAATGRKAAKGRPARKLSKKLVGTAGSLAEGGKAAAASAAAKVAGGVAEGAKHTADVTPETASDADDANAKQGGLRLSKEYVQCILSFKPGVSVDPDEEYARMTNHPGKIYSQEFIDESVEIFRDIAEMNKSIFARFGKLQDWMRSELQDKGYVEVDDEYIAQRVRFRLEEEAEEEAQTDLWVNAFGPRETLNA